MTHRIDRAFVRMSAGLIHYRSAGEGGTLPPLVLLHGGPGSSAGLVPMMAAFADGRRVIAPDTPGCGDSDPLPENQPEIADYAAILPELLERLNAPQVDVYGHHTGAQIACELAIIAPERVRRMALDGVAFFPEALRHEFVARYAPPIVPLEDGSHLKWIWEFVNQLTQHFPHYDRDDAHRVSNPVILPPATLTNLMTEILKAWPTWHRAYAAAFRHNLTTRLPLVDATTLVLQTAGDPLSGYAKQAVNLLRRGVLADTTRDARIAEISDFLGIVG